MLINKKLDWSWNESAAEIVQRFQSATQTTAVDEDQVGAIIEQVIVENPDAVERYQAGQKQVLGFFMGQVVKKLQTKTDPKQIKSLIEGKLG